MTLPPTPVARQYPALYRHDMPLSQNARRQRRRTSGERLTDVRYTTTGGSLPQFIDDSPTGHLGCGASTRTTRAHGTVNAHDISTSIFAVHRLLRPLRRREARSPSPRRTALSLRRSRQESLSPCLPWKTECGNTGRRNCQGQTTQISSTNVGPLLLYQRDASKGHSSDVVNELQRGHQRTCRDALIDTRAAYFVPSLKFSRRFLCLSYEVLPDGLI